MKEIRKAFDKKIANDAENKTLNSWMGRDRKSLRIKRDKSYFAPKNEIDLIYESTAEANWKDNHVFQKKQKKPSLFANQDYNLIFDIEDISFNFAFKKEEMIVFINLDCLIFTNSSTEPLKDEIADLLNRMLQDWNTSIENRESTFVQKSEDKSGKVTHSVLRTPKSTSPPSKKIEFYEYKNGINNILFPAPIFTKKLKCFEEKQKDTFSKKLIAEFDETFDFRIEYITKFIHSLRNLNIKFYCFTKTCFNIFACRLVAYGLAFIKSEEMFFLPKKETNLDLIPQLYEDKKKAYFFGFREKVADDFPGRTTYHRIRECKSFINYMSGL